VLDAGATTLGRTYTLTPNPDYWAKSTGEFKFTKIVEQVIGDTATAINAAETGQVDFVNVTPGETVKGFKTALAAPTDFNGVALNTLHAKPLSSLLVRQAMNYAVNRQAIVKDVYQGKAVLSDSAPFIPGEPGYDANYYPYDPKKARQLLAEAGYPHGFSIDVLSLPPADSIVEPIASYERAVGINMEISDYTTGLIQQAQSGKWPIGALVYTLTGQPFTDVTSTMTTASFFNFNHNTDPKIDSLLTQAASASTTAKQNAVYSELGTYAAQQAWFIVPAMYEGEFAYDAKVLKLSISKISAQPSLYDISPA
jgi:peptide/nickel transport system substrate-binding protein